ncbi:hypothetical protein ACFTSF_11375 [Kribbella sp. NPDC056951]|uniref:hypothetical protein n=1 Tax=Kribbella sp. NPDC056951 TaxID=3345978 RepID=UPI00363EAA1B
MQRLVEQLFQVPHVAAGKQGEVIMIDPRNVNLGMCLDPVRLVVTAAQLLDRSG